MNSTLTWLARFARFAPLASLAAAVSALSAGCASTPPSALSTAPGSVPVATAWQAPLPHGGATADISTWWQQFNDPALPALQAAAQAASPTLASARARIERARAARVAAGAALLPQVDAVASASSGRSVTGQPNPSVVSTAGLGVQAAWELDLFGGVAAGRIAAQARLGGAQAAWHEARVAVAAEVASSVLALRACEAQAVQTRADATSRNETARLTGLSESAGFTAPADTALARASAAQSRNLAVSQQAGCDTLVKSLVEITDLPEPDLRQRLAAGTARVPQPAAIAVSVLPASLLSQRPDLAEAARAVEAAAADQAQSRAQELPRVSLSGSFGGAALRSGGITSQGTTWSLGPLLVSLPLFDGGARSAATASAKAGYDEAVALYQAQVRRAVREVETALVALESTAQRRADADSAARDFEASLRATQARQQGGLASLFDLEAARRNAVQAQSALIDLQREQAAAWIALYRALGGGWNSADSAPSPSPSPTSSMAATP